MFDQVDYAFDEWTAIINDKLFKKIFPGGINSSGILSKVPKAFDEENKAGEFLRMKGFYTMKKLTDKEMMLEGTIKQVNACFKTVAFHFAV